ncbi:MAG: adenylate/guanylate cyclase domain-containing protein [Desulfomonilaceae bacterium]
MQCRNCRFENPAGMKFCGNCGSRLDLFCPQCNSSHPPDSKFCGQCGHPLIFLQDPRVQRPLSFDEKLTKIQRYLPGGLTEKILSQKDKIEGERRQVTIMFVDMKGFTPLTERLGPEETFALMDQVFEILINCIHDYEGTVNELRGDGILALFGSPIALEDAPLRAVRSSLAIHREMIKFSEKLRAEEGIPPILVRIGINTGPVVVGSLGNDLRVQFTAVGDTINMAARMEQLAEPGTTYVTEETFRPTEGFFRFEALGKRLVKGKKKPVKIYRVLAPSTRRTRFDVSAERGLTYFIGRQRELGLLLESFEQAKAGRGQAVSVVGEAGVGKSRLLYEFRKAVANENILFLEGRCLSYCRENAYHPIVDMLKSNFGVEDMDTDADITDKVKRGLAALGIDETTTLPYLLDLLSVKDSGIDKISMSPAARKDRILHSLRRLVVKGSERRPLILAFEDLHWTDKSSEETAKYLLESIPRAKILMILTYRPEFVHTWGGKSFHNSLTVNRLSNRESLAMVSHILGSDDVAMDLFDLILEKTEGVPFFIEEFVRALKDMEIIKRNESYHLAGGVDRVAIPSTIQDTVMARVDSLPDSPKEVLQAASAIGREFSFKLIKAVTELPEPTLLSYLSALMYAELVYERGIFPESTYIFRHAITREVVYDSILTNKKKLLHRNIGKSMEDMYGDNLDSYSGILADHFMLGEDFQKSADYSRLASERAYSQAAVPSAISYAQKRITGLESLPPTPENQLQLIDTRIWKGQTLFTAGHLAEAKEAIEPILEMTVQSNDKNRMGQIYFILGAYQCAVKEESARGLELLRKAIQSAEEARDARSAIMAHFYYGESLCLNCQFESGAKSIRKAIRILEAVQNLWAASALYSHLSYYAHNYQGKVDEGFATSRKALEIAENSGDIHSRAHAYVCHGISYFYKGLFTEAEEHILRGIDLCEYHPIPAVGHQALGYTYFEKGDYKKSYAHHQKAIEFREQTGVFTSCINLNKIALARAIQADGPTVPDIPSLVQLLKNTKLKLYSGKMARHLAEILLDLGEPHFEEVESWVKAAILNHEETGMKWDLASDYLVFAQFMKSQGRPEQEKDYLNKALSLFKQCGAEGWCRRIETGRTQG